MARITMVGCGLMGSALTQALMDKGHQITIVVRNPDKIRSLLDQGAAYQADLADALDSDFVIVNLPNHAVAMSVVSAVSDRLNGVNIINTTTSTPTEIEEFDEMVRKAGGRYLDCKIECYPAEVATENGFLVYSGDESLFQEAKEALSAMSEPLFLSRSVGTSAVVDMGAVLDLQFGIFYALLEGTALALQHNCDVNTFFDVVEMVMPALVAVTRRQMTEAFSDGIPAEYQDAKEASLDIEYHALQNVVDSVEQSGINATFSSTMLSMMKHQIDQGNGKKDIVAMMAEILKK